MYGWTFDAIDEMSWEQIDSACRAGKPARAATTHSLEEAVRMAKDLRENWREYIGV